MLYSIQNSGGELYGVFAMPRTNKSAELIAHELKTTLHDILGINGVVDAPLVRGSGDSMVREDRVVIDIEPAHGQAADRIIRVHQAIGNIVLPEGTEA